MHADGVGERAREVVIDHLAGMSPSGARRNRPEPAITACAPAAISSSARRTLRTPPPTRQGSRDAICLTSASLLPLRHRRVEVDQLHLWKLRELLDPAVEIVGGDGELVALHELNDAAALEVDRWNQHRIKDSHGDTKTRSNSF